MENITVTRKGYTFKISLLYRDDEGNSLWTVTLPNGRKVRKGYLGIRNAWNAVRFYAAYMTKGV